MPHKKHKAKKKSKNNIIVKDENVITKIETTNNTEKIEESNKLKITMKIRIIRIITIIVILWMK